MASACDLYWKLVEVIKAGDDEATRALIAPDFVLHQDEGMPYGGFYRGPDEYMDHVAHLFGNVWVGANFTPRYQIADPDGTRLCTVVHLSGNIGPASTFVETEVNEIWEFRDDQAIKATNWYWNTTAINRALAGDA